MDAPGGVVSNYLHTTPHASGDVTDGGLAAARREVRYLATRVAADDPAAAAGFDRIEQWLTQVFASPDGPRGRARLTALPSGRAIEIETRTPFARRITLDPSAPLLPLLAASMPAHGLVVARDDEIEVVSVRADSTLDESSHRLARTDADWREQRGPRSSPVGTAHSVVHEARHEARIAANRARALRDVAAEVAALARRDGWEFAVIVGSERAVGPFAVALSERGVQAHLAQGREPVGPVAPRMLADQLVDVVSSVRSARTAAAVHDALEGGLRPRGAAGFETVARAALARRVDLLLIDATRSWRGVRDADGSVMLLAEASPLPAVETLDAGEWLVSEVLDGGGVVTASAGSSLPPASDGVVARLRF